MPYINSKLTTVSDTAATVFEPDLPNHDIGDLLLVVGTNDVGTSTIVATIGTSLTPLTIVNPGAELGVTGWTNTTGVLSTGTSNGPVSGTSYFDGGTSALVVAYQDLNVSSYSVAIDAGNASFYLGFWVSGFASDADTAGMDLDWLNASNTVTGTITGIQTNGATTWAQIESTNAIPVGTRKVRIKQRIIRNDGTNNDGYIDDISAGITTPTSNTAWTVVNPTGVSDTVRGFLAYKLASTANETIVLTGANGVWVANISAWKDVHQTLPINASSIIASAVGATHTTPAITTTASDCTIVNSWHLDSSISSRPRLSESSAVPIARGVNDGTESIGFLTAYRNQSIAGASTPLPATMGLTNGGHVSSIAIRNIASGTMGQNPTGGLTIYRTFQQGDQSTATAPNTVFSASVPFEGIPFSSAALAWANATLLNDAPQESTGYLQATNSTAGSWTGGILPLTATVNMSSKSLSVMYGISSTSRFGSRGFLFALIDTLGNYAVYRMRLKSGMSAGRLYPFDFDPSSHPKVLSSDTAINLTLVNRVSILYHRNGSSATSNSIYVKNFAAIDTLYVTGGGVNNPIDLTKTPEATTLLRNAYRGTTQGVGQVQLKQPVQIGNGGINYTNFKATATSYELPLPYSETGGRYEWRLPSKAGLTIEAGSLDVIDFSAAIVRANDPQPFTISSASNAAATYSFSGAAIVGWDVTWKNAIPCDSANFSNCGVIDAKSATVNNCSITSSRSTTHAMLVAGGADITNCRFVKGAETYAINIPTAGDIDLTGTTFTGYTTALNVTATTSTVTISISLTQTLPTYITAGAAVVFVRPIVYANAQVTGFTANSRVIVYNVNTGTEVYNGRPTGTSWTLTYVDGSPFTAGDVVEVYHTYFNTTSNATTLRSKTSTSVTASGWSVLVTEENDDVYSAYVNSYSIIASTVTEFSHDPVNLQIDFNDTDDVWYAHRMYAWNAYTIWSVGARRFFTEMTAVDAANISIGSIVLDNTRANTAYQSDVINIYNDASNLPVLNPTSGGGGITLYSGGKVLLTASAGIAPSEYQIKTWLREELAVEMARIDVATSTRLAAASYTAPTLAQIEASTILAKEATVSTRATQTSVSLIPVNPLLTTDTRMDNLDVAISTRLATASYAAPTLAQIETSAILAKSANVATLQTSVNAIPVNPLLTTDTRLNNLDVAISTRLSAASYTAPTLAQIEASTILAKAANVATLQTSVNLIPVNPLLTTDTRLNNLDAAVSTRLATASYAAPTLAQIEASNVLAKSANVATLQTSVNSIPTNPLLTTDTRLNNLDATISTRLAASTYVAPDNASITAIKAKTDTLVNTDISTLATAASVTALGSPMQASSYVAPANSDIAAIKAKTDTLVNTDLSMVATAASVAALGSPLQASAYVVPPTAAAIATQVEVAILTDGDGQAVLQAIADKIGNENVSAAVIAAQVRTELTPELARIDVASSTLAKASNLIIVNDGVKLASLLIPHATDLI